MHRESVALIERLASLQEAKHAPSIDGRLSLPELEWPAIYLFGLLAGMAVMARLLPW
jgi:hypothetical protein